MDLTGVQYYHKNFKRRINTIVKDDNHNIFIKWNYYADPTIIPKFKALNYFNLGVWVEVNKYIWI